MADTMLEAPMVATAMEFLARASSTSEVLTLNLTNLLILLVLKALIFGFGLFSVGGAGRSLEERPSASITQSEVTGGMYFLMYTSGDDSKLEGLQRVVCEDPKGASEFLTAAKMWYKMHKMLKSIVPFSEKYAKIMYDVQEAEEHGMSGAACADKYSF